MKAAKVLIWHAIRKFKSFDCAQVAAEAQTDLSVVQKYVREFLGMGYLMIVNPARNGSDERTKYLRIKGSTLPPTGCRAKRTGRDACWVTMRIMRRFTVGDLCATTSVSETVAHKFVAKLLRVKVLRIERANNSGAKGSFQAYRLVRDLGVGTPILMTDGRVLDVNSGKFLEIEGGQKDGI